MKGSLAGLDAGLRDFPDNHSDLLPAVIKGHIFGGVSDLTSKPCAVNRSPAPIDLSSLSFARLAPTSLGCVSFNAAESQ
jgi:hypothetical protein